MQKLLSWRFTSPNQATCGTDALGCESSSEWHGRVARASFHPPPSLFVGEGQRSGGFFHEIPIGTNPKERHLLFPAH